MYKTLPVISVYYHMTELTGFSDVRDVPVLPMQFTRLTAIGAHGFSTRGQAYSLGWHYCRTSIVADIRNNTGQIPAIDQAPLNSHRRTVSPPPIVGEILGGEFLEAGLDRAFFTCPGSGPPKRAL